MKRLALRFGLVGGLILVVGGSIAVPGLAGSRPSAPDCSTAPHPAACAAAAKKDFQVYIGGVHKAEAAAHFRLNRANVEHFNALIPQARTAFHFRLTNVCPTWKDPAACVAKYKNRLHHRLGVIEGKRDVTVGNFTARRAHRIGALNLHLTARYAHAGSL